MLEREHVLLGALLQGIQQVYSRTGRTAPCEIPLPVPFQDALTVPPHSGAVISEHPRRLIPIVQKISLNVQHARKQYVGSDSYYPIAPLSVTPDLFLPKPAEQFTSDPHEKYSVLWDAFIGEMAQLQHQEQFTAYLFTLFFLLKKYFSRVPSPFDRDLSFFDAARVRAAIEDCRFLYQTSQKERGRVVPEKAEGFLLIEGKISGIRSFVYSAMPLQQGDKKLAQRLRGRSFYVLLLMETLLDTLVKRLGLTIIHQIWCLGERFLIVAPHTPAVTYRLKSCYRDINALLLQRFRGDLALVLGHIPATEELLTHRFDEAIRQLGFILERETMRTFSSVLLDDTDAHFPSISSEAKIDATTTGDDFVQHMNEMQEEIGAKLTRLNTGYARLVKWYLPASELPAKQLVASFELCGEPISWTITEDQFDGADIVYVINDFSEIFWGSGATKYGFKSVPMHADTYVTMDKGHHPREIKDFEAMAESAKGLGILRIDVDSFGAVFRQKGPFSHIARMASLSADIHLFFSGYLQELCRTKFRDNVYVNYAGGDDLLAIGAWDQLVELACCVRKDFTKYVCQQLTVSGGLFICDGTYPIHRAVQQAETLLNDRAKANIQDERDLCERLNRRNAIAIFQHRMPWDEFLALRKMSLDLIKMLQDGSLNQTFLQKLLTVYTTWKRNRQMNTAHLYYMTVRTIENAACRRKLLKTIGSHRYLSNAAYIPVLVGYTNLKMQK